MSRTAPEKQSAASETPVQRRRKVRLIPNAITLAVGENLRSFREERGMTQLELAMSAEVERTRVSKVTIPRQSRGHSGCEPLKAAVRGR